MAANASKQIRPQAFASAGRPGLRLTVVVAGFPLPIARRPPCRRPAAGSGAGRLHAASGLVRAPVRRRARQCPYSFRTCRCTPDGELLHPCRRVRSRMASGSLADEGGLLAMSGRGHQVSARRLPAQCRGERRSTRPASPTASLSFEKRLHRWRPRSSRLSG